MGDRPFVDRPYSCRVDGYIKWLRDRVGHQKVILIYASICIVDDNGRLLWQQRGDFGWWGLPGGVLELDEDLATCAVREAKEETGLEVALTGLVGVYTSPDYDVSYPNGDEAQQVTYTFSATVVGGELNADKRETLDLQWRAIDDIPDTAIWYRHMAEDLAAIRSGEHDGPSFASGGPGSSRASEPYFKTVRRHIGQAPFVAAAAIAAVFDDAGRLLLVRRADDGTWSLPGGMIELGERIDQTVINEVKEETALDIEPVRLIGVHSNDDYVIHFPNGDVIKVASCLFRCRLLGGTPTPDLDEILEARFFTVEDIPELGRRYKQRVATALNPTDEAVIS